jgi:hypothetical protein
MYLYWKKSKREAAVMMALIQYIHILHPVFLILIRMVLGLPELHTVQIRSSQERIRILPFSRNSVKRTEKMVAK